MAVDLTRHQEVWWIVRQAWHLDQVFKVLQVPAAIVELPEFGELLEEPGGVSSQSVGRQMLVQQEQELDGVVVDMYAVLNISQSVREEIHKYPLRDTHIQSIQTQIILSHYLKSE